MIHVHATDFDRSRGNVNPDVYRIEKDGMDHADHIITVSDLTRRTVIEKYHQDPAKVTTVHNAVIPLSDDILNLPKRKSKEKVVTFLGRITMQKGPEYFVEAAAKVLASTPNVRFVMAGSGDKMEDMINLVPSIISKQSGCAEILHHVIKTDYWDIDAMADAIHGLVTYAPLHRELQQQGVDEIKQITWEKAGKKVVDIYKQVIAQKH